jgi:hypothetical protein
MLATIRGLAITRMVWVSMISLGLMGSLLKVEASLLVESREMIIH